MTKCSTRHEYADLEGRGFCIGLKLIEVKARISAMSGGISFYIGLKLWGQNKQSPEVWRYFVLHRPQTQKANLTVEGRAQKPVQKTFAYKRKGLIFPSSFVVISLSSRNNSGHANNRCEKTQASNNADDKQRNRLLYKQKWLWIYKVR